MKLVDYNHILLYAKGHYVRSKSPFNDVRHIIAVRCGLKDESVSREHVYNVLLSLLLKYSSSNDSTVITLLDTFGIRKLFPNDITTDDTAVDKLLSPLSITSVYNKAGDVILNVGEPDTKILARYIKNKY